MSKVNTDVSTGPDNVLSQYFNGAPQGKELTSTEEEPLKFPLTVSQLASAAQTTVHTVRNYVAERLLQCSAHSPGGFGLYGQCALNRLRFIRAAREAGLLIQDIKPVMAAVDQGDAKVCYEVVGVLQSKIEKRQIFLGAIETQLSELRCLVHSEK